MIALAAVGVAALVVAVYELATITALLRKPTICAHVRANPHAQVVVRHLCADHH